ncbi:rab-GTPase-TBC domain-containing protein, partial [Halenospora varia]
RRPEKHDGKASEILDACESRDVERLRNLAISEGGLLSDHARRQAWPLLLGNLSYDDDAKSKGDDDSWRELPRHSDEDQVQLDVNRSFIYYPEDQSMKDLDRRKGELSDLITEVLRRQPYLCYFQGYHDICQVFLLVLEPPNRASTVARLSTLRIRDFMLPTLAPALAQLRLIPAILYAVNPELYDHLSQTQPFFALSGTLTMYAHDIQEYGDIARLFDVLLARESVFSVYMFAQIVLQRSEELFETPADEPEMLHSILSKLPKPLDLESLISGTVRLFEKYPPEQLRPWRQISQSSVLKTARWQNQILNQTLEDGEVFFKKQVKELEWANRREKAFKAIWKYRRPATGIGLAVTVAVVSY